MVNKTGRVSKMLKKSKMEVMKDSKRTKRATRKRSQERVVFVKKKMDGDHTGDEVTDGEKTTIAQPGKKKEPNRKTVAKKRLAEDEKSGDRTMQETQNTIVLDELRPKKYKKQQSRDSTKLENQDWYFGVWPRDKIVSRLKKEGAFLCRLTRDSLGNDVLVISACAGGKVSHAPINVVEEGNKTRYAFDGEGQDSVYALIAAYISEGLELNKGTGIVLKKGICRPDYLLRHRDVEERALIGPGPYEGEMLKAMAVKSQSPAILVKSSADPSEEQRCQMIAEAEMLTRLQPNDLCVKVIGLLSDRLPMGLILEDFGQPLLEHLKTVKSSISPSSRMVLMVKVFEILEFLKEHSILHRNLRAANFLVEGLRVKLSEFSHAQKGERWVAEGGSRYSNGGARWASPEVIDGGEYSARSEVWAGAIVCYEIWTCGERPFGAGTTETGVEVRVRSGEKPNYAQADELMAAMYGALDLNPSFRPSAADLVRQLRILSEKNQKGLYLQMGDLDQL